MCQNETYLKVVIIIRTALKQFRVGEHLTQAQMANKIGVSIRTYGYIENGKRGGNQKFWRNLQNAFDVPDNDMWKLQKLDERAEVNARATQENHS